MNATAMIGGWRRRLLSMGAIAACVLALTAVRAGADSLLLVASVTFTGSDYGGKGNSIVQDGSGDLYIGGFVEHVGTSNDLWIGKYDQDLVLIASATFEGGITGTEYACDLAVDGGGNVFVAGSSSEVGQGFNAFVGKFDPDLVFQGSVTVNGSDNGDDSAYGLALGGGGNLFVTGMIRMTDSMDDIWIAKYDSDLVLISSRTQPGFGSGQDSGEDIILSGGDVYVTSLITESAGGANVRLAKYTTDLVFIGSTGFSGGDSFSLDWGRSLAAIPGGGFYVAGSIESGLNTTDAWIGRFDAGLTLVSSMTMDGSAVSGDFDRSEGVAVDGYGYPYVTGRLFETDEYDNVWTAKYDPDLVLMSSHSLNGDIGQKDNGEDLLIAPDGAIFATGGVDTGLYGWIGKYRAYNSPPANPEITEVFQTSVTVHYGTAAADGYMLEASTASDFSGTVRSSSTPSVSVSTLTVPGLIANTTYFLRTGALWGTATFYAAADSTSTLAFAPAAAAAPFLSVWIASMTVAWDRNGNAVDHTSYTAVLSTGAGYPNSFSGNVSLTTASAGADPAATLGSLEANTSYYLFVEAVNHGGIATGFTALGSTSTLAARPLSAVSTFTAMASGGFGALWDANGNPLVHTSYTVEASTASDFNAGVTDEASFSTVPVAGPQAAFSGLSPNTTYYFRVLGVNHNAVPTDYATLGSTSTLAGTPAPAAAAFPAVELSSMTVSWDRSGNPVAMTTYTAVLSTGAAYPNSFTGNVGVATSPVGTQPMATLTSLEINTTYYLYVEAVNHNGVGTGYPSLGSTSTLAAPPIPLVFTDVGPDGFGAQWSRNGNPAGVTTYRVEGSSAADFNAGVTDRVFFDTAPAGGTPQATFTLLGADTTYYFRVRSVNHNGVFTDYAILGSTITLAHVPGAAALTYPEVHLSSMSVSWDPNGNPLVVTTYTVALTTGASYPNAFTGNVSLTTTPGSSPPTATLTALEPNTTYFLFVDAVNFGGTGSGYAGLGSTSTLARAPTSAVSTFSAVTWGGFEASWDADGNPLALTTYTVHASTASDFNPGVADESSFSTAPSAGPQAAFTGLSANTTYYFRVRAVNHNGLLSDYTALGSTITLAYAPAAAPTSFAAVHRTSMSVSWDHNGNVVDATTYTVVLTTGASYPNPFSGNVSLSTVPGGSAPMATLGSLTVNTTYSLFVEGVNYSGAGSGFTAFGATSTLVYMPAAAAVTFAAVHNTSMTVSWDPNGNLQGLTTYTVVLSTGASYPNTFSGNVSLSTPPPGGVPTATLLPLSANTTYSLFVEAVNHNGVGGGFAVLGSSPTLTAAPLAAAPTFIDMAADGFGAIWDANANPLAFTTFTVHASTALDFNAGATDELAFATVPVAGPQAAFSGLNPNTTYHLRVNAVNHGGVPTDYTFLGSTSTLSLPVSGAQLAEVFFTSAVVNWVPLPTAAQAGSSSTAEGYVLEASTASDFSGAVYSSVTAGVGLSTLTLTGLDWDATYYFRVGSLNWHSVPNYAGVGSTKTLTMCIPVKSAQSGPWSQLSTWDLSWVPLSCSDVTVAAGHAVTVDITTATASGTTVDGTLSFSRVTSSSLTIAGGDMTVAPGGALDMGTEASPVPMGVSAHLVLALGATPGQYGLILQDGGDFTVRGATKTPYALAVNNLSPGSASVDVPAAQAVGWEAGDTISIGPTQAGGLREQRVITGIAGTDPLTFSWSAGLSGAHYSTGPLVVANLTRNVLVRSSGTDTGADTAYIHNLAQNATSFSLSHGEFAYLGADQSSRYGIVFDGAGVKGTISSSTIRDGYHGVSVDQADGNPFKGNAVCGNAVGLYAAGSSGNIFEANALAGNSVSGIGIAGGSSGNAVTANYAHGNQDGVALSGASQDATLASNEVFANSGRGIHLDGAGGALLADNLVHGNAGAGIDLESSDGNTLISNVVFGNAGAGLAVNGGSDANTVAGGSLGYDAAGSSFPDNGAEVAVAPGFAAGLTLKRVRVNSTIGISTAGFDSEGAYLLSYNQSMDTGTLLLHGDHTVAGSTLTLDYAAQLYLSTATAPKIIRGTSISGVSVDSVYNTALTQLITVEYSASDSLWHVTGSSSGELGTLAAGGGSAGFPAGTPQFDLTLSASGAQDRDAADFGLIGASGDVNREKRLLFGRSADGFRGGRSKLTVAPGAGLELLGVSAFDTIMDRLDTSSTYYIFVDSGAFTASFAHMANMDPHGLQLSGSEGVVMSSSTFDFMGVADATNAYITARDVAGNAALWGVDFNLSRSTHGTKAFNVLVEGDDSSLSWTLVFSSGPMSGAGSEYDPNSRVHWESGVPVLSTSAVTVATITWAWDDVPQETSYRVILATDATSLSGDLPANTTEWIETGLSTNTVYERRVLALSSMGNLSSEAAAIYTAAAPPAQPAVTEIFATSMTVSWTANTNPSGTRYLAEVSTSAGFITMAASSQTVLSTAPLTGLASNTTHYVRVRAINGDSLGTGYVSPPSTITIAAVPASLVVVSKSSITIELDWQPNGNPEPGTWYEVWRATEAGFSQPVKSVTSTSTFLAEGLEPLITYFFRVRGKNDAGSPGSFTDVISEITMVPLPAAPGAPEGVAQSTHSILWTWPGLDGAIGYRVYSASSPADRMGEAASIAYLETGLSANTTYGLLVSAVNASGEGAQSAAGTAYTLAGPPVGLSSSSVHATSATLSWSLDVNPPATVAELERSTDASAYTGVLSAAVTTHADSGLLGCTTYYYRVRDLNGAGIPTAYDGPLAVRTAASTPSAPGGLYAEPLSGRRVHLAWNEAPFEGITDYRLYHDAMTGTIDYNTPIGTVPSTATAYTTGVLGGAGRYRFGVRAVHRCGVEEQNTTVVASAIPVDSLGGPRTAMIEPQSGQTVKGDRLTLLAGVVLGEAGSIESVRFQFIQPPGGWTQITPTDPASHPNPDPDAPYFIHWDVTGLSGQYEVRAVATDKDGVTDVAPPAIMITVDNGAVEPDVDERAATGRQQKVNNAITNTLRAAADDSPQVTELVLPAGALDESTKTVTVVSNPSPASLPAAPEGMQGIGVAASISLSAGQTQLAGGQRAIVTLSYPDLDGDGIVDGTALRAGDLRIYSADGAGGPWEEEFASTVDLSARTVTGRTTHFSLFGLFVPSASDLGGVRVYPNPFKPNSGSDDDGKPYTAGDLNSGIIFDQLPDQVTIRIYTLTGRLVAELGSGNSGGALRWNARNSRGQEAASGLYFAVLTSPGNKRTVRKFVIIK